MPMGGTPVTLVPDGTSGATSAGIVTVGQLPAAAAGADATANPTSSQVFAANELFNGTTWDRQRAAAGTTGIAAVNAEGTKATYRAATSAVAVTAQGIMLSFNGSATKLVTVARVRFSGTLTTAALAGLALYRCTGAVSTAAGTVALLKTKMATADAASVADAVVNSYTSSTIGAGQSQISAQRAMLGSATVLPTIVEWTFGDKNGKGLKLSGVGDFLQLFQTCGGYTGASFDVEIEWTEE